MQKSFELVEVTLVQSTMKYIFCSHLLDYRVSLLHHSLLQCAAGNRVARFEGPNHVEVEELLQRYQMQNSKLDLFSEVSPQPWGEGRAKADFSKTPRTTARFLPGYDWGSDRGFFDTIADKAEKDFMGQFETSWIPDLDDDDRKKK